LVQREIGAAKCNFLEENATQSELDTPRKLENRP
jgi:hypothetical protein